MKLRDALKTGVWLSLLIATAVTAHAQTFTTLVYFNGRNPGEFPQHGPLVQGLDGRFYGTTLYGGSTGGGIIFKMTPAGVLTTVHTFDFTDGGMPYTGLILATDRNFLWGDVRRWNGWQRYLLQALAGRNADNPALPRYHHRRPADCPAHSITEWLFLRHDQRQRDTRQQPWIHL